jgi:hypothetical protein
MWMLFGNRAANNRLVVLFPTAGGPTTKNIGFIFVSGRHKFSLRLPLADAHQTVVGK